MVEDVKHVAGLRESLMLPGREALGDTQVEILVSRSGQHVPARRRFAPELADGAGIGTKVVAAALGFQIAFGRTLAVVDGVLGRALSLIDGAIDACAAVLDGVVGTRRAIRAERSAG